MNDAENKKADARRNERLKKRKFQKQQKRGKGGK